MSLTYDTSNRHSKQPLIAFVEVYVSGHLVKSVYHGNRTGKTRAPEYIQSLEVIKQGASGEVTLTMFDKNWTELERIFNLGNQVVSIKYGYTTGLQSPLLECIASQYNIDFHNTGIVLSVKGIVKSLSDNTTLVTLSTGTTNPTEAVRKICEVLGYNIGVFEESRDIDINLDSFNLVKEHPISYINSRITPYAINKRTGVGGYRFILDTSTNPPTANFVSESVVGIANRTYIYGKGIDSSVISLDVTVNGYFGGTGSSSTTTAIQASSIDQRTEEVVDSSSTTSSNSPVDTSETQAMYTNTRSTQEDVAGTDGLTRQMSEAAISSRLSLSGSVPYEGTMTILGDPTLRLMDIINLVVLTTNGEVYNVISGNYFITGITDSIQNGRYVTVLSIRKKLASSGIEEVPSY